MSLNYRAFQFGLSPGIMGRLQPAPGSQLLFLIAGFKNNCLDPHTHTKARQWFRLHGIVTATELGNDADLFAYQVRNTGTLGGLGGSTHDCMSTPCPRQLAGGCQFSPFLRFLLKQLDLSENVVECWHVWEVISCRLVLGGGWARGNPPKTWYKDDEKVRQSNPHLRECCWGSLGF